jgi:hypothetical protein
MTPANHREASPTFGPDAAEEMAKYGYHAGSYRLFSL